jgi:hypothetical protein
VNRARMLIALGIALAAGLGAGQAQANTYCAELPGDASCDQNFMTSSAIQDAVDSADANPGPDTVKIGPGTFAMPSPVYLSSFGEDNTLTLVGSGPNTVLSGSDPANPEIHFNAPQGSSISDLTVSIPDDASNTVKRGLVLTGDAPTADNIDVNFVTGTTGNRTTGVELRDGATLSNSVVTLSNANVNTAVGSYAGTQTVQDSSLTAFRDVDQRNTSGTLEVRRSALIVIGVAGLNLGGTLNIRDSVIVAPYGSGDGVFLESSGAPANTLIDGTTMVGTPGSVGVVAISAAGTPTPGNTHLRLHNSVVHGYDFAIAHTTVFPEDTLNIDVDSSAYDSTRVGAGVGAGTPDIDVEGLVDLNGVDPELLDPGNGDYSLAPGSPLIDTGQAAAPPAGSKDLAGNPRACDGNDDGLIRRDIGAYEFRANANDDCVAPETTIVGGPGPTTTFPYSFSVGSNDGEATWRCSFDGGAKSACGPLVDAPDLGLGPRTFSVQAADEYGNTDQTPAVRQYTVIGSEEPGDTTPPRVTKLKAPKKTTKKRAKVTFRANEAGAVFTCRLNKSKPKPCKSPWKTPKLKKGKNTIEVSATDEAGNRSDIVRRTIKRR